MSDSAAFASILTQLAKLVKNLGPDDLKKIVEGETKLFLAPKKTQIVYPFDPAEVAAHVRRLGSQDDIVRFLDGDKTITAAHLKQLAAELNIPVSGSLRAKPALVMHIAQEASAYERRNHGGI